MVHENVLAFPDDKMMSLLGKGLAQVFKQKRGCRRRFKLSSCMSVSLCECGTFELRTSNLPGDTHKLELVAVMDPTDSGFPVARTRKYMLISRRMKGIALLCWAMA